MRILETTWGAVLVPILVAAISVLVFLFAMGAFR